MYHTSGWSAWFSPGKCFLAKTTLPDFYVDQPSLLSNCTVARKIRNSLKKSLYDADDAKFSQDISTPEGRLKKLQTLRDSRLNSLYIFLPGMFLFGVQIIQFLGVRNTDASDVISVATSLSMIIAGSTTYQSFDSQIKMLLLFEQTQPKG